MLVFETLPVEGTSNACVAVATLDRPQTLNALSETMIQSLYQQLLTWQSDEQVSCVVLTTSSERAFCAGGDVKSLAIALKETDRAGRLALTQAYFQAEYRLDYLVHTYSKPIVVFAPGFIMGGGLSLIAGASHVLMTPTTRWSMPEISIGLYPDVGASYFLNHFPGKSGLFCGLTGYQGNAADAVFVGLAAASVPQDAFEGIIANLCDLLSDTGLSPFSLVDQAIAPFKQAVLSDSNLYLYFESMNAALNGQTVAEVVMSLEASHDLFPEFIKAKARLAQGSAITACLVFEQLKRTRHLSLKEIFDFELNLTSQICLRDELLEGVRALLLDKDQNPKWQYKSVNQVPNELIEAHFEKITEGI